MSNHFFLQSSSLFLRAPVSTLLNKGFMIASRTLLAYNSVHKDRDIFHEEMV